MRMDEVTSVESAVEEGKVVSVGWLQSALELDGERCEEILKKFVELHPTAKKLYRVVGRKEERNSSCVAVLSEEKLEAYKTSLKKLISESLYAVHAAEVTPTPEVLYNTQWSLLRPAYRKHADNVKYIPRPQKTVPATTTTSSSSSSTNRTKSTPSTSLTQPASTATKTKSEPSQQAEKKKKSASSSFFAAAKTTNKTGTDQNKTITEGKTDSETGSKTTTSPKKSQISAAFSKVGVKERKEENEEKGRVQETGNVEGAQTEVKSKKLAEPKSKTSDSKSKKTSGSKDEKKRLKKRKREEDEEDSDVAAEVFAEEGEGEEGEDNENAKVNKAASNSKMDVEEEAAKEYEFALKHICHVPLNSDSRGGEGEGTRRRVTKKRKVLKKRKYKDEKGYTVTEEVWTEEEYSTDEEEVKEPKRVSSPAKRKQKEKPKQKSQQKLMSFFGKK